MLRHLFFLDMDKDAILADEQIIHRVTKLLNKIFSQAISKGASDIHIEPHKSFVMVRFRVDGQMVEIGKIENSLFKFFSSRMKIMSGLDISEKRIPQDGRMSLDIGNNKYAFRVATLPSLHGENIVIRILNESAATKAITDIGIPEDLLSEFKRAYTSPNGIIFVAGPTGSGKTTTLYAVLNELNDGKKNIISIENPIEYEMDGITQSQVSKGTGMTFDAGLRAMLRLDPDVLMVGEIRDAETAKIATEAAMTGHLVLSTIHTNDSTSAPSRLIDMGVQPFLLSSSIRGVLSQRLVKKLCPRCKQQYIPNNELIETITKYKPTHLTDNPNKTVKNLWEALENRSEIIFCKPHGCEECNNLGFKGRLPVYELLTIDDDLAQMIIQKESANEIRKVAYKKGMRTLFEHGLYQAFEGETSLEEIFRVIA
jgi:type II secretory ATPase GspE/PulE/Tfp pilus assembly ATPase PilB-like protein